MATPTNSEWRNLDFQNDVRPVQLQKLAQHKEEIAVTQQKMDENNHRNLEQIDLIYKDTTEVEAEFIGKKMENMNLINQSELSGIKFLHEYAQNDRQIDSIVDQINAVRYTIALLNNEVSIATHQREQIEKVFKAEEQLLEKRDKQLKAHDQQVLQAINT